jgi:hypothetical protein
MVRPDAAIMDSYPSVRLHAYRFKAMLGQVGIELQDLILSNELCPILANAVLRLYLVFDLFDACAIHHATPDNAFKVLVQPGW